MPEETLESLVRAACGVLRPDASQAFESAWDWAVSRARSEEEVRLITATLVVLSGVQAVVVPRRLAPGALADLHITGTRTARGGPLRRHVFVCVTPDGSPPPGAEPDCLCFTAAETRTAPFRCAGRILGELLTRLAAN